MKAVCLNFHIYEFEKQYGILLYEWLLEFARKNEIPRGIAARGIAGYGSNSRMHEEHFFELASDVPIVVSFILSEKEKNKLLLLLKEEKISLFFTTFEIDYDILNEN